MTTTIEELRARYLRELRAHGERMIDAIHWAVLTGETLPAPLPKAVDDLTDEALKAMSRPGHAARIRLCDDGKLAVDAVQMFNDPPPEETRMTIQATITNKATNGEHAELTVQTVNSNGERVAGEPDTVLQAGESVDKMLHGNARILLSDTTSHVRPSEDADTNEA